MLLMPHPGKTIAKWMKARDITQGELSRRSGISQPTIQRILSGESQSPKRETIQRIARVFGRSIDDAYDLDSKPAPLDPDQEADEFARMASAFTKEQVQVWHRLGLTDQQINLLRHIVAQFRKAAGR